MSDLRCGHCGREGFLEELENLTLRAKKIKVRTSWGHEDAEQQVRLVVMRCTRCDQVTLLQYSYVDGFTEPGELDEFNRIYPETRDVADLPERVRARYSKMLELAYEPDAFAMRAGKVLEAICSHEGYTHGNLGPRLDKLIADDRLPQALGDQAHLVREYRNIGSHDDGKLDVETEDVPLIRDFVESLLDYLYWGPSKLARVKAAIETRMGHSSGEEPKWKDEYRRVWKFLNAVANAGGDVSPTEISRIARENGYDPRGLGGFYVGDNPSLRRDGDRRRLTEVGRSFVEQWMREFGN